MIIVSNLTTQTLVPGQSITFDSTILHTGCGESHRQGMSAVKLRANGCYELNFTGNIGTTTGTPATIVMTLEGQPLRETTMTDTTTATNVFQNVGATTAVKNTCGEFDTVSVTNIGAGPVVIAPNSALFIKRLS